jgi:hypothetical protein
MKLGFAPWILEMIRLSEYVARILREKEYVHDFGWRDRMKETTWKT